MIDLRKAPENPTLIIEGRTADSMLARRVYQMTDGAF